MYNTLSALLRKPKLYEKTQEKFWNDPHISKGMLEAHLDPNTDVRNFSISAAARDYIQSVYLNVACALRA